MTAVPDGAWSIERRADSARALHEPWPARPERGRRVVALCSVRGPRAVVLGSSQTTDLVALETAGREGVDVVHRGSGGGAVLVGPAAQVWFDVWLPRRDPLWDDDVIRSSWWLGETWARALGVLGAPALTVHHGRVTRGEWAELVCFAGVGPGEVTAGATKVVGVAQRRSHEGARLHSMAPLLWDPGALVALLALDIDTAQGARHALEDVAVGLGGLVPLLGDMGPDLAIASVEDALVAALP